MNQLSDFAERMFWRLTTVADDAGRFDADVSILSAACFPRRASPSFARRVAKAMLELEGMRLIQGYMVEGRPYGYFPTWAKYQRIRMKRSLFPEPPQTSSGKLPPSAAGSGQMSAQGIGYWVLGMDNNPPQTHSPPPRGGVGVHFETFWTAYPRKRSKGQAQRAWATLSPTEPLQAQILAALERAKTSAEWAKDGGRYIPYPATWLRAKGWEDVYDVGGKSPAVLKLEAKVLGHALSE